MVLLLAGCGKEAGRVPFSAPGKQSASVQLAAGDVAFWTDIDIKLDGPATLTYGIELKQGGSSVAKASCDPLGDMNVKIGWIETTFGESRSRRGSGKMSCSATLAKGGLTEVDAELAFGSKPTTFTLRKADLVLKQ